VKRLSLQVVSLAAAIVCGGLVPAHANEASPSALVDEMSMALKTLNYEGVFVHLQGMSVTSMHILHASDASGELERMTSLDGEAREVIRNDRYDFTLGNPDRVAGRDTHVVEVKPRDKFRYGYRFWIDQETKMLLRSMLLDGPDMAVEQVLFTSIEYPEKVDLARFDVDTKEEHISWIEPKTAQAVTSLSAQQSYKTNAVDRVGFLRLPDGYEEVSETYRPMPIDDGPISHVMVSDGMASVSVYVEHVKAPEQDKSALGLSKMGAMNAYGLSLKNAFITVVGEVPASTVMAIAEAVQLKP